MRRLSRAFATVFLASVAAANSPVMANGGFSGKSSPLCLVPVYNGLPIKKDLYQAFRMISKVVVVPGLNRPIIFPWNRGGVWTVDDTGTFVPFGGEFPNHYGDEYASDTSNGDVIGVSDKLGVFRLRRGEKEFQRIYAADGKPFVRPFSAVYVARFGGTVISDNSGLYLLKSSGEIEILPWDKSVAAGGPGRVFDLPELNLLLFTGYGHAYLRDDSGKITVFDDGFNGIQAARVTARKEIFIQPTTNDNFTVPWPPTDPTRLPAHQGTSTYENFEGITVYVGDIVAIHGRKVSIDLPSRSDYPLPMEFPVGDILVKPAENGIYTLNSEDKWDFVDRSGEMAVRRSPPNAFHLPAENKALLINGSQGLHLLVLKTDERAAECLK
ncbi:hypothetical protein ACU8MP_06990 [Rhizobium leguminosarum]|uniref:hypothetical protein n=1 Tax=Rhizobium leguminosarum TaxID=384 RepID=UPI002E133B86|nr:hypothetical protein U8Q02_09145 [Rhizobium leguminosarum]